MKLEQLSVFLENRAGRLAEVTRHLSRAGISIRALSLADTSDFGILRFISNDQGRARAALEAQGFTLGRTDVLALELQDQAGGLDRVLQLMAQHNINIEYMYGAAQGARHNAVMIFRFDKTDRAQDLLQQAGFPLLSAQEIG